MRVRAPRHDEARAVHSVIAARDVADIGRPDYTLRDVLGDWGLPEFDLARDAFVVEDDDGEIVGWADTDQRGARVAVHPDHEGRGVGTLLRAAVEARMRERGLPMGQAIIATNAGAVEHLRAAGYERTQVYRRLRAPLSAVHAPLAVPARGFDLDLEGAAVHALIQAGFGEIDAYAPLSYATWYAEVAARSEPAFRLALDDAEGLVAAAVGERWEDGVGYVAQLAVPRRARGRGHGRALLLAMLAAFRGAGLTVAELSVAGTNAPATGLYESVGMAPEYASERWELAPAP